VRRALALLALCAALVAACGEEPRSAAPPSQATARQLAGSPPELRELHDQANRLLGGGPAAFRARLRELRGHPVVVNKWASWCGPCRTEFPHFQRLAVKHGRRIAFLGVNTTDNDDAAKRFLRRFPVTYPSYVDPEGEVARVFKGTVAFPTTAFYDRRGKLVTLKQGGYATERDLATDIARYAR
jgi:cytochrome c biogenesis protein CcmG/thiol:disulfide interchange protein DsbE